MTSDRFLNIASIAALGLGLSVGHGYPNRRRYMRELTLDEVEEGWVQTQIRNRRQAECRAAREAQRAREKEAARIAAEIEAARPKSRQELRAKTRAAGSPIRANTKYKPQSASLKRLLKGKRK
jgi:hypothetical protein